MPTAVTYQVAASSDDAREVNTAVTLDGVNISLSATTDWAGFRFQNVTIPPGSTIDVAYLQLRPLNTANDDPFCGIWGHASANSPAFTTSASDITSRERYPSELLYMMAGDSVGTNFYNSDDIKDIIQYIIDLPGWASGNAISLIAKCISTTAFVAVAYDGNPSYAARLYVEYASADMDASGSPQVRPRRTWMRPAALRSGLGGVAVPRLHRRPGTRYAG